MSEEKLGDSKLAQQQIERYLARRIYGALDVRPEIYAAKVPPLPPQPEHRLAGPLLPLLVEERLRLTELRKLARVALADGYDSLAREALEQADLRRMEGIGRRWEWLVDPRALTKQTVHEAMRQPRLRGVKLREAVCLALVYPELCRGMILSIAGEECISESRDGGVRANLALIDVMGRLMIGHCFPEDQGETIASLLAVESLTAKESVAESQTGM